MPAAVERSAAVLGTFRRARVPGVALLRDILSDELFCCNFFERHNGGAFCSWSLGLVRNLPLKILQEERVFRKARLLDRALRRNGCC